MKTKNKVSSLTVQYIEEPRSFVGGAYSYPSGDYYYGNSYLYKKENLKKFLEFIQNKNDSEAVKYLKENLEKININEGYWDNTKNAFTKAPIYEIIENKCIETFKYIILNVGAYQYQNNPNGLQTYKKNSENDTFITYIIKNYLKSSTEEDKKLYLEFIDCVFNNAFEFDYQITQKGSDDNTPLHLLCQFPKDVDIMKYVNVIMGMKWFDISDINNKRQTVVDIVIENNNIELLKTFLAFKNEITSNELNNANEEIKELIHSMNTKIVTHRTNRYGTIVY